MAIININGTEHDYDALSQEAKAQLNSRQFVDQEIAKLQAHLAVMQTARMAYSRALNELLPDVTPSSLR